MTIHDDARAAAEKVYDDHVAEQVAAAVEPIALELATVKADRERIATALAASEDDLKAARAEYEAKIAARDLDVAESRARVAEAEGTIVELRARIAQLEAGTPRPEPEPEPTPRKLPLLGANPQTGAGTAASITRVTDRWGGGIAVRLFESGSLTAAPAPGDAGRILISWKPGTAITEAQVRTAVANLPAGSKVGVWHEPDVKVRKGSNSAAGMKARAREFYAIVKRIRPDLVVMAVLSEWTFNPAAPKYNPLDYIELGTFDALVLDLDGGDPGPRDYRGSVLNAQVWIRSVGITRWGVGEYGWKLAPGFTAADRAVLLREQTEWLLGLEWPPEEICLFELNDGGEGSKYILTGPDKAEWDRLIALGG